MFVLLKELCSFTVSCVLASSIYTAGFLALLLTCRNSLLSLCAEAPCLSRNCCSPLFTQACTPSHAIHIHCGRAKLGGRLQRKGGAGPPGSAYIPKARPTAPGENRQLPAPRPALRYREDALAGAGLLHGQACHPPYCPKATKHSAGGLYWLGKPFTATKLKELIQRPKATGVSDFTCFPWGRADSQTGCAWTPTPHCSGHLGVLWIKLVSHHGPPFHWILRELQAISQTNNCKQFV